MSDWELLIMVIQSLMKHFELKDIIKAIKEELERNDNNNADADGYHDTLRDSNYSGFAEGNKRGQAHHKDHSGYHT